MYIFTLFYQLIFKGDPKGYITFTQADCEKLGNQYLIKLVLFFLCVSRAQIFSLDSLIYLSLR